MSDHPIPRATYRLQLTKDFPFERAAELAPYLHDLGISHAYLSPILKARRGSQHGYDTVDHTILNPELGTATDFKRMVSAFRDRGMGVILDIVPNHMGIGGDENDLWLDVLRHGRGSRFADWFDIEWSPSESTLKNKVLVPFLGSGFGEAMERGAFELRRDERSGDYSIWTEGAHQLPVAPSTYAMIVDRGGIEHFNSPGGREDLVALIGAQHWRPARYSVAADDINYRRFFIVSDLAAIRVERDDVFERVHALTFDLVAEGLVNGLRVDHIDGLYDPKAYCLRLREACPKPIYLVVEKILAPHETLRDDWGVDGTTGYEFASAVTRLITDPRGEQKLTSAYRALMGETVSLAHEERDAKRDIADYEMAAELDRLALRLRRLAASVPRTADLTRNAIRGALREVVAAMPVYRTYVDGTALDDADGRNIALAVARAREATPAIDPAVFEFLGRLLTGELCRIHKEYDAADALDVAMRIQQYTGPVMAKGLEDTALYRYNRLIALSDVGEKPDRFSTSIAAFHDFIAARAISVPNGMLTSSSHDTKRGEDARARIAALSGHADEWLEAVSAWGEILRRAKAPELPPNDAYYFFQLLLGSWPTTMNTDDRAALGGFRDRIDAAMLKSVREARMRTNWAVPKTEYENDVSRFVQIALDDAEFLASFVEFEGRVAPAGAQNGLIDTVLKLTVPGVPDIYQGSEFWEQSMVDPDNRRPVDFAARAAALASLEEVEDLIDDWRSGTIKQRVIARLLAARRDRPDLFSGGTYEPLEQAWEGTIAFARRYGEDVLLVAASLYPSRRPLWSSGLVPLPLGICLADFAPIVGEASARLDRLPVYVGLTKRVAS